MKDLYLFGNFGISVKSNSLPLLQEIKTLFLPFYIQGDCPADVDYFLEVSGDSSVKGGFYGRLYKFSPNFNPLPEGERRQNKTIYETSSPFEFISYIEWAIIDTALEKMDGFYQIHGGAVAKDSRGLILPAAPGGGKTTLTVGLAMNGFQCLSDDIALIELQSLRLNPFPRNIFITEEKKAVFDRYGYIIPLRKSEWMDMGGWDFIPPHPPSPQPSPRGREGQGEREFRDGGFHVDFIIFPEYNPALKTELKEISKGKAMFKIIRESFNFHKLGERGIDIAYNLIENAECFKLAINDLNKAVEIISDLFSPQRRQNSGVSGQKSE